MNRKDIKIIEDAKIGDIPLFVFTAKDLCTVDVLEFYKATCSANGCDEVHMKSIEERIQEFKDWQNDNPDKTKIPDTGQLFLGFPDQHSGNLYPGI